MYSVKIPYETVEKFFCVTPCPFIKNNPPFVGSAKCNMCVGFYKKDKDEKIVYCQRNFDDRKKWEYEIRQKWRDICSTTSQK